MPSQAKLDLGYGPISDDKIKKMVKDGQVKVEKDGTLKRTASAPLKLNNSNAKPTTSFITNFMLPGAVSYTTKKKK